VPRPPPRARASAAERFGTRELGALHAHRQHVFRREKVGGCCAHTSSRTFRRERVGGVARPPTVKCFGVELGAFHALTEAGALIVSGLLLNA